MLSCYVWHPYRIHIFPLICSIMLLPIHARALTPPSGPRVHRAIANQKHRLPNLLAKKNFRWGAPIYLRIFKSEKKLEVWLLKGRSYHLFKCYPVCTYGGMGLGPKTRKGDGFAPEGYYDVGPEQMNPFSSFYLYFNLGYPNAYDRFLIDGHVPPDVMVKYGQYDFKSGQLLIDYLTARENFLR